MQGEKCLNIKNKSVAEDLNLLTSHLGSYEAAYYVLSENDGIMPDSTQTSAILGIPKVDFKVGKKSTKTTNPDVLDFVINKISQAGVDIEYLDSENFSFTVGDTVLVHGSEYAKAQSNAATNHPLTEDGESYVVHTDKNNYHTINVGGIPVFYTVKSNDTSETIAEGKSTPSSQEKEIIRKVNNAIKVMSNRNGVVYGFTVGNKIFLFKDRLSVDTPIHEYTHLWCKLVRKNNPELWGKIKNVIKKSDKFKEISRHPLYENDTEDDRIEEAFSVYSEMYNSEIVSNEKLFDSDKKTFTNNLLNVLNEFWQFVLSGLGINVTENTNIRNYTNLVLRDLITPTQNKFEMLKFDKTVRFSSDVTTPSVLTKEHEKLIKSTKNRINLFTHSTQKVQQNLERLNNLYNKLNQLENDKAVLEFTQYMVEDVNMAFEQLRNYQQQYADYKLGRTAFNPITPEKLDIIKKGTIGFYNNIIINLRNMLDDSEVMDLYQRLGVYSTFRNQLDNALTHYNELVRNYNILADKVAKDRIIEEATKQGSFSVEELRQKLDENDSDIGFWDKYVGQTQYNSNEVIRLMLNKMVGAKLSVHDRKLAVGKKLLNLLDKVSKSDLKLLYERGKDGKRTGNLVRELNYGQHEADYIDHMLKFLDTLDVTMPAGMDFHDIPSILNSDQLKKWNKEKNKWDAIHTERRFTPEFYELLEGLSNEAIAKKTQIDHDIKMILNPTIDANGQSHREELSQEDYDRLISLETAKRNLSNPYNADGSPKVGEEKRIAEEFAAYNKKLQDKLKYTSNKEGWEKARKQAKRELSPEKYQLWLERNSLNKINEKFYADLSILASGKLKTEKQISYEEMRQQLMKLYTFDGKVDADLMPSRVKQYISTLDFLISEEIRNNPNDGKRSRINEIAEWKIDSNFYIKKDEANRNGTLTEWEKLNGHYNSKGQYVPASFWKKLVPKKEYEHLYIDTVPNSSWVEIDKTSPFYNSKFDESNPNSRQPKKALYDNSKNYSKVKGSLKELYDGLVNTLDEANANLPFLSNSRKYILPQIEGGAMTQILSQDNVLKGLGYAFKDTFTVKDDDTQYNVDKALDPDGSRIRLVPTRYMRKLDNPEALTNDIVGSVIAYYGMAANYDEMSNIAPEMEIMTEFLSRKQFTDSRGGTVAGVKSNTYNKANQILEQFIYGMEENDMTVEKTIGKKKIKFSVGKAIQNLARFTRLNGMGNNLSVILTGLFTNKIQSRLDAISGIYYDNEALAKASLEVQSSYLSALSNLGSANNKNKVLCFLEWTGTVRNSEETFSKLNQSRWLRALNQHFWWGGYEAADYITKGKMAVAIALMYKLDPSTGKFIHKNKFMLKYKDKKQAKVEWNRLNVTLYDAFTVNDNQWVVKPEYKKYVDEKTLNVVRNTIKQTGTRIDTQFTDLDKSFINSNAFCKLIFIYRNFLLINLQTKFITKRHYDYSTDTWQEAQYRGAFNYLWRHVFDKSKIDTLKEMYRNYDELDEFEKRLFKRVSCEIAFSLIGLFIISSIARSIADDDDDNWFKNLMALISVRVAIESRSNLLPVETVSMFNSPTAAWGIIEHFGRAVRTMFDEPNKIIKKGAYKGKTRFERSLIKISPFRSLYEIQDPRSKLEYYDNLVSVF